jgi:hypothetical protein
MSDPVTSGDPGMQPPYQPKLFTAADLDLLPTELPSGPVLYEIHHGRLVTLCPPGDVHGAVENKIAVPRTARQAFRLTPVRDSTRLSVAVLR